MLQADAAFEKAFKKLCAGREDHEFKFFCEAMNCHIYSKEHYKHEMLRRGMVPLDMAEEMADEWDKNHKRQDYDELSPKARSIINSLKLTADKHGNISLGGRAIKALQEIGAIKPRSEYIPQTANQAGGFSE